MKCDLTTMKSKCPRASGIGLVAMIACLSQVGCSSLIDGIIEGQEHNDTVNRYQHRGYSEDKAEKMAFEDEFFDDMERHRFEEPPKKEEYILKVHEDEY